MREQLIRYVDLLFAGDPEAWDIKQEILQNTLDRFDDLVSQGKTPQAAYQLAICGIGDINEILGNDHSPNPAAAFNRKESLNSSNPRSDSRLVTGVAIAMYILCPVPVIILGNIGNGVIGVSMMFLLIAAATALLVIFGNGKSKYHSFDSSVAQPVKQKNDLQKSINTLVSVLTMIAYLFISFATDKWMFTWLIFPIGSAVKGFIKAILDLKEACHNEA